MVNGEATNGDHSDKNGVVDTEKQTSETKQNGNANSPTKEVNSLLNNRGLCYDYGSILYLKLKIYIYLALASCL